MRKIMTQEELNEQLLRAAKDGNSEEVKRLLEAKADVNAKDVDGQTPLQFAAEYGHTGIAAALIAAEANVNAKARYGITPLHLAARNGHTNIVQELIAKGADVNAKNNIGYTPLLYAAANGHTKIAAALIAKGADVNAKNTFGGTPLHWAAAVGKTDTVKKLIEAGAKVDAKNTSGKTALDMAISNPEFYNIVIDAIAKQINHTSIKGMKAFTMGTLVKERNQSPVNMLGGEKGLFQKILGKVVSLKLSDIPEKEGHRKAVEAKLNELQREHAGPHAAQVAAGRGGDLPRGRN
ncbi:MAG: ankyrin repeat domain-containing protein [Rickettsiales bacterium]|nr:ankyrin repeat domain-containing protein [Rickettsiales bacterium]